MRYLSLNNPVIISDENNFYKHHIICNEDDKIDNIREGDYYSFIFYRKSKILPVKYITFWNYKHIEIIFEFDHLKYVSEIEFKCELRKIKLQYFLN
jgi:hypothetical protein